MINFINISSLIIIKKYNCAKCHKINKKFEIPSFKDISLKYNNNIFFKKYLFKKIKFGSKNVWGKFVMPANKIKNFLIKFLINWILKIKNI